MRRYQDARRDGLCPRWRPATVLWKPDTAGDHEALMRHQWVIDVLVDLQSYATVNDLPQLAARIATVLAETRQEIIAQGGGCPSEAEGTDPAAPPALRSQRRAH